MTVEPPVRSVLCRLAWTNRWKLGGYLAVLLLGVVGARLGESQSLWWYLLAAPMVVLALMEIPSSIAESKAGRAERARVRAIADERGHDRHLRRRGE